MLTPNQIAIELAHENDTNNRIAGMHPWHDPERRLWSLWEMLKTYAGWLCALEANLTYMGLELAHIDPSNEFAVVPSENRIKIEQQLRMAEGLSIELNLESALDKIQDMLTYEEWTVSWTAQSIEDLISRIDGTLKRRKFLYVPLEFVEFWENENYFGEEVIAKISDARTDIYEACSCFAVGRSTATVYHCIGIMQMALFKLAEQISAERIDLDVDDWGSVVGKIQRAVNALEVKAKANSSDAAAWALWKELESKYNEIISDANAVKKAWRHQSAHFRQTYNQEQAKKVLDKVGDFIKDVAALLP